MIFRKGVKYAEQVKNHGKEAITVMFCGSAAGDILPPFVIYKAKHMYESWRVGGPDNAKYAVSAHGWIDQFLFCEWFKKIALPYLKSLPGKKILIGDNLHSHFSEEVFRQCAKENVEFVCLPVNSTHKLQPLDVGFFGPMKKHWRRLLNEEMATNADFNAVAKAEFPRMLKALMEKLNYKELLPSAFRACGIYPLNVDRALRDIPTVSQSKEIATNLDSLLLKKLERQRFGDKKKKVPRGKQLPAGASYSAAYMSEAEEDSDREDSDREDSDGEDSDGEDIDGEVIDGEDIDGEDSDKENDEVLPEPNATGTASGTGTKLVVAVYEEEWFVAEVAADQTDVPAGCVKLMYMAPRGKNVFAWPERADIMVTEKDDILVSGIEIEPVNSRGYFRVKDNDFKRVKCLMVVVIVSNFYSF